MGFENQQSIGLLEKAAKIALRRGVTYDSVRREFHGNPEAVKKAAEELNKWIHQNALKRRQDEQW